MASYEYLTSVKNVESEIDRVKKSIAESIFSKPAEWVSDQNEVIQKLQGKLNAYALADSHIQYGEKNSNSVSDLEVAIYMVEDFHSRMFSGAKDTSSGRGNDSRRAEFDGFLSVASVIVTKYQTKITEIALSAR